MLLQTVLRIAQTTNLSSKSSRRQSEMWQVASYGALARC